MTRHTLTLAALLLLSAPAGAIEPSEYCGYRLEVVDGDTVRFQGERVRLLGYDTPETYRPSCEAERAVGEQATARLTELLSGGYACLDVSAETDHYGRPLGTLTVDGRDVGDTLVAEGLAIIWRGRRGDWCGH